MISAKVSFSEKATPEFEKLKKLVGKSANSFVTVGIHEDAGQYTKGSNPPSVVQVALWNEFGTEKTPKRSFFQSAIDENQSKIEAFRDKMVENILFKDWTPQRALEAIGFFVQNLIQNKIKSNVPPAYGTGKGNPSERIAELQEAKRRRVGHTQTLRESELMLRSITFKVTLS